MWASHVRMGAFACAVLIYLFLHFASSEQRKCSLEIQFRVCGYHNGAKVVYSLQSSSFLSGISQSFKRAQVQKYEGVWKTT